ncbi:L-histidine N(alpha)-methyltransferase [Hahella ganghwensis]|uniref:L-histidine N(alpha)-methyltransferase n=1 Tax=Hahella ganghwensis TaxID=286420 RepID=UPI00036D4EA4|nr:L-histidine N(alpha)-methyltransferase [Hahella ganghwensis]
MNEIMLPVEIGAQEQTFYQDVVEGLSETPKRIPSKYFYDQKGSELFEQICDLEEYYLTRTELGMLDGVASDLANFLPKISRIVEFGSGNCEKVQYLLDRHSSIRRYLPIDVSESFLLFHADRLMQRYHGLDVLPVVGDFNVPISLEEEEGISLGFFPGSTIGNLDRWEAIRFLRNAADTLGTKSYFLVGVDTLKDRDILLAAYDDAKGVTRDFNLNLLRRLQQELGANLNIDQFEHEARFNQEQSRIEMHLKSRCDQTVRINGDTFRLIEGETIHTENSHKYSVESFQDLARLGGWESCRVWLADGEMFSIHLLKRID